jgi:hypothetical protein
MSDDDQIDYEALRAFVTAAVKPAGTLSSRALSLTASSGRNPDLVRNFLKSGTKPNFQSVYGICDALEISPVLFMKDWFGAVPEKRSWLPVVASVEAGIWRDKVLWSEEEWYEANVNFYSDRKTFNGCLVKGRSMDRVFPPGVLLRCGEFHGIWNNEADGKYYIIIQQMQALSQLTCRRLVRDRLGHWELRCESYLPEYGVPIRVDLVEDDIGVVRIADIAGGDVRIVAQVVDAYLPLTGFGIRPFRKSGFQPAQWD